MAARVVFFRLLLATTLVAGVCGVAYEFPVSRLLQFDESDVPFGSRTAALNLQATVDAPSRENATLNRRVVVLKLEDATPESLQRLLDYNRVGGLLLLLPTGSGATPQAFQAVEEYLLKREVKVPVYFTPIDSKLAEIYTTISHSDSAVNPQDNYQLVATATEGVKLTPSLTNFQGWLSGAEGEGEEEEGAPTLAVVAHYDAFAAAPGLATGGASAGSGVVALLELARLYSRLYASPSTRGRYNLLFVLTAGGGGLNYAGAKQWLDTVDSRLLSTISLALCIHSLTPTAAPAADAATDASTPPPLFLHSSKPATSPSLAPLLASFTAVAEREGAPSLTVRHAKVNVARSQRAWQHQRFALKRVTALTLSTSGADTAGNSGLAAPVASQEATVAAVCSGITFAAEALAGIIYGQTNTPVFRGTLAVDPQFVSAWLSTLSSTPRFAPFLAPQSPLLQDLEKTLNAAVSDSDKQSFALPSTAPVYYGPASASASAAAPVLMRAYRVKPISFDVYLTLAICAYLAALALLLHGPAAGASAALAPILSLLSPGGKKESRQKFKRA